MIIADQRGIIQPCFSENKLLRLWAMGYGLWAMGYGLWACNQEIDNTFREGLIMACDFRKIEAWQRAHHLTLQIYQVTINFPSDERFGLVSQLRRACASIPTNIAEGCGRRTISELARFVDIATGSASEVEYQLLLAKELGYLSEGQHSTLETEITGVRRMLLSFNKKLRS
ncbi:MAG: four helix bundle protein [Planctomycetota bacterium]|nr:four helix bundle protein [Planctomycetota bacterium]